MSVPTSVKRAVLVGVQSQSQRGRNTIGGVPGAHQDVKKLRDLLIDHYQFKRSDIKVLMDSDKLLPLDPRWPTRDNIVKAMKNLVQGRQAGDHIVFSFSGHGEQTIPIHDKNEIDGLDEILIPVDGETVKNACGYSHFIRDDEIRQLFVDQLAEGVHCTLVFDCCHSGTASDLPEVETEDSDSDSGSDDYRGPLATKSSAPGFKKEETLHHRHAARNMASDPNSVLISDAKDVTSWSACTDAQATYGGRKEGGRFTEAFVSIVQDAATKGRTITHRDLLLDLRARLKATCEGRGGKGDLPIPHPQLGSLIPESILDQTFTF